MPRRCSARRPPWTLVALLNRRWLTAGALVLLAGTVRSTALALIAAVAVAVLTALIQDAPTRQRIALWWRPVAALLLAPLGLLGYSALRDPRDTQA